MNRQIAAGLRQHFGLFVMKVFQELKPGAPPLEMAWYLQAMTYEMSEAYKRHGARLVVNVPPRHLKSVVAAVALPAWVLGKDPMRSIMVATYAEELARGHSLQFRQIMAAPWYRALFPNTRISSVNNRLLDITTTLGGGRRAVTVGGGVTGHGAELIIMDDCLKAEDARSQAKRDELKLWYDGTLSTRLNAMGGGAIISIAQRLSEDDLPAHQIAKGYDVLNLPAIAERDERIRIGPGRFHQRSIGALLGRSEHTREMLEEERRDKGAVVFSAMYQQNPVLPGGNLIRPEWFGQFDPERPRHEYQMVLQSWDTAVSDEPTADYSVCVTAGLREGYWHILDVYRARLAFPDLRRAISRHRKQWRADKVLIEHAGSGISLWQEFKVSDEFRPIMRRVPASKEERVIGITGQLEAGQFRLPSHAPWLDDFLSELRAFPHGRFDDQVDSLSQLVAYSLEKKRSLMAERDPVSGRVKAVRRREHVIRR